MSVLFKGMDMPETCRECSLSRKCLDNDFKQEQAMVSAFFSKRPYFCLLIALPEKHGRLIDVDEYCVLNGCYKADDVCKNCIIRDCETILESEE